MKLQSQNRLGDISVVVPFYNRARFAHRLLTSINEQTLRPSLVYMVDNGSTFDEIDACQQAIDSISWGETEVVLISTRKVGNANYARNLGMDMARTRYIAFLDSDDWWDAQHLENSLEALSKSSNAAVYSGAIIHANDTYKNDSIDVNMLESPFVLLFSRKDFIAATSSYVIDMQTLPSNIRWDETLKRHQDYDFFVQVYYSSRGWSFLPKPSTHMDWKDGGTRNPDYKSMIRFLKKWESVIPEESLQEYLFSQILTCNRANCAPRYLRYYKKLYTTRPGASFVSAFYCSALYLGVRPWLRRLSHNVRIPSRAGQRTHLSKV